MTVHVFMSHVAVVISLVIFNSFNLSLVVFLTSLRVFCAECYSEASDHEEAENTEIPPPPYSDQTLRDSVGASGPPGSTHQVSPEFRIHSIMQM